MIMMMYHYDYDIPCYPVTPTNAQFLPRFWLSGGHGRASKWRGELTAGFTTNSWKASSFMQFLQPHMAQTSSFERVNL